MVKRITNKKDTWHFVDVNPGLFNRYGEPRADMFQLDTLHHEKKAYTDVWAPLIKEKLSLVSAKRN